MNSLISSIRNSKRIYAKPCSGYEIKRNFYKTQYKRLHREITLFFSLIISAKEVIFQNKKIKKIQSGSLFKDGRGRSPTNFFMWPYKEIIKFYIGTVRVSKSNCTIGTVPWLRVQTLRLQGFIP